MSLVLKISVIFSTYNSVDWLEENAEPGHFLSNGNFKLLIDRSNIETSECFTKNWFVAQGLASTIKCLKLTTGSWFLAVLNTLTLTNRTRNGHNTSGWKNDVLLVKGFDERMQYGGRLISAGIKLKQIRYRAITMHLDHARGYVLDEVWRKSRVIRKTSIAQKIIATPASIKQVCISE